MCPRSCVRTAKRTPLDQPGILVRFRWPPLECVMSVLVEILVTSHATASSEAIERRYCGIRHSLSDVRDLL